MKQCTKCKENKEEFEFNKTKNNKSGLTAQCKICLRKRAKNYRTENSKKFKETRKKYYYNNTDKMKLYSIKSVIKQKDNKVLYDIEYRANNKEKIAAYKKKWEKERKDDPIFKIKKNLRRRVHHALKGTRKSDNTFILIGCTAKFFRDYIEKQFSNEMTWDNYGSFWHIDHIIPCYTFDLTLEEEQRKCFHYSNQRPLLAIENLKRPKKNLKYEKEFNN